MLLGHAANPRTPPEEKDWQTSSEYFITRKARQELSWNLLYVHLWKGGGEELTLAFFSLSAGVSVQTDLSPDFSSALFLNVRGPSPKFLSSGGRSVIQDSLLTCLDPSCTQRTKLETLMFSLHFQDKYWWIYQKYIPRAGKAFKGKYKQWNKLTSSWPRSFSFILWARYSNSAVMFDSIGSLAGIGPITASSSSLLSVAFVITWNKNKLNRSYQ